MSKEGSNFTDNDSGVSPVIGMILILVIVTVSIGIIYSAGIPMLDSAKLSTHLQNMQNSFSVLHNDIEEVVRGPITGAGTARTTSIPVDGGTLAVVPNNTRVSVSYTDVDGTTSQSWLPGTISYEYKNRIIVYENGAVFSTYPSGALMEIEPLIYVGKLDANNVGVMIHIINISGANMSSSGKGTTRIRTYAVDDEFSSIFTGDVSSVSINITSQNYQAWDRYLNKSVSNAGATYSSTFSGDDTVSAVITNPDHSLGLSVHETKIRSTVG